MFLDSCVLTKNTIFKHTKTIFYNVIIKISIYYEKFIHHFGGSFFSVGNNCISNFYYWKLNILIRNSQFSLDMFSF